MQALLEALGGVDGFAAECARRGWDIRPYTIHKWGARDRIPAYGLAAAFLVLNDEGQPLTAFIGTDDGPARGTPADQEGLRRD